MSKYIIDVGDAYTKHICGEGDMLCLPVRINEFEDNWLNTNIPLTLYTEPDTEKVREEAYERGAEDMRKALRLLIDCDDDCLTNPDIFHTFREGSYHAVVRKHPAMEIIEKIQAYEQEQEEKSLKVEDVMRQYLDTFCTNETGCSVCPLHTPDFTCGRGYSFLTDNQVSDDEVRRAYAAVLAKMKEGS